MPRVSKERLAYLLRERSEDEKADDDFCVIETNSEQYRVLFDLADAHAEIARLREQVKMLRGLMESALRHECPWCGAYKHYTQGFSHENRCEYVQALAATTPEGE